MNIIERNNITISNSEGQPMIFAHGYGCDQNMWRLVAPSFESQFQTILFDHVGAGLSNTSAFDRSKYGTLDGYAGDLLEICHKLDLQDVIFVGHSVSATIGILAAIKEPKRFANLILIGPSPCYINDGDYIGGFTPEAMDDLMKALESNYTQWAKTVGPLVMGNADRPELGVELAQSFCRTRPEIAKHFAQVTFLSDHRKDLSKLAVKSLILQCSQDVIAPESVGRYMHQQMKQSEFVQLKATGHCPHLSAPDETIQVIQGYLSQRLKLAV